MVFEQKTSVAVLMTCHNRRERTLACLGAVFGQELPDATELTVYLVDDGSTDGTGEAVSAAYPEVRVLRGNGSLFWNGGMRLAFAEAMRQNHDFYLWLNDDTVLYPKALGKLLATHRRLGEGRLAWAIVVGSTRDPETGAFTYGGVVRSSRWHPLKVRRVEPGDKPKRCDTMNGNCVLISRRVARLVGNLDPAFTHAIGDFDYGLRAARKGCAIWIGPGYVGTCRRNSARGTWNDAALPFGARLKKMGHPKGLPLKEYREYARRHAGPLWPFLWLLPSVRAVTASASRLLRKRGKGDD